MARSIYNQNCYSIYQFPCRENHVISPSESSSSAVLVSVCGSAVCCCVCSCRAVCLQTLSTVCGHRDQQRGSWDWHVTLMRGEHEQDNVSSLMFKDCRIWVWSQIMNDRTTDAIIQDSNETFPSKKRIRFGRENNLTAFKVPVQLRIFITNRMWNWNVNLKWVGIPINSHVTVTFNKKSEVRQDKL